MENEAVLLKLPKEGECEKKRVFSVHSDPTAQEQPKTPPKDIEEVKDSFFAIPTHAPVRRPSYPSLYPIIPATTPSPKEQSGGQKDPEESNPLATPKRRHVELNMYLIEHSYFPCSPSREMIPANSQPIIPLIALTPDPRADFGLGEGMHTGSPLMMPSSCLHLASTPTLLSSFTNALGSGASRSGQTSQSTQQQHEGPNSGHWQKSV